MTVERCRRHGSLKQFLRLWTISARSVTRRRKWKAIGGIGVFSTETTFEFFKTAHIMPTPAILSGLA